MSNILKKEKVFLVVAAGNRAGLFWKYGKKYNIKFLYVIPHNIHNFKDTSNQLFPLFSSMVTNLKKYAKESKYIDLILSPPNFDDLLKKIDKKYKPLIITPGTDVGVELAEKLAAHYRVIGTNNPKTTINRIDKYMTNEILKQKGVRYIKSCLIKKPADVNKITKDFKYPLFFKPNNGSGGVETQRINSVNELKSCVNIFFANKANNYFSGGLIQEFVEGDEYIVDFVVVNGKPYLSEIGKYLKYYVKLNNSLINVDAGIISFSPQNKLFNILKHYGKMVLKAIDFKWGAVHLEIIVDKKGPVLIEVNNRIVGGHDFIDDKFYPQKLSRSEFFITKILNVKPKPDKSPVYKYWANVNLNSMKGGIVIENNILKYCKKIKTFKRVSDDICIPGQYIPKYRSLLDAIAWIELLSNSEEQIIKDCVSLLKASKEEKLWKLK